jgi:hypothetical protein
MLSKVLSTCRAQRARGALLLPQRSDEAGAVLFFRGCVKSSVGAPLAGVELDMWQPDANGHYSNIHPNIPECACANASIQVTMELSRSGRLFPRRMRSRRVVRPELCLRLLAGISFARHCSFALLNRGKETKLLSPCMQKEGTVSSGSATVQHVGTEKTDLSD